MARRWYSLFTSRKAVSTATEGNVRLGAFYFPSRFAILLSDEEGGSALWGKQKRIDINPELLDISEGRSELLQNESEQATNSQTSSDVQPDAQIIYVNGLVLPHASRLTYQQSSTKRYAPLPPRRVIAATVGEEKCVLVDVTGYSDPQAIREHILNELQILSGLHSAFSIYRKGLVLLNDRQLFLCCLKLGDDKGSLVLVAQHASGLPRSSVSPHPAQPTQPLQLQETSEGTTGFSTRSESLKHLAGKWIQPSQPATTQS
ncbi:hypothetical protein FRC07_005713 [Ceratobasidium sp. 392]|nr:hypothetical protein FRC07_005713 [Ceratobasidium sp. 392]